MGKEYELKFAASAPVQASILEAYPGSWQTLTMQTTYYDTPTGALSARRYTLRKRMENGQPVCTLKTPGGDGSRGEWEVVCDSITDAIPMLCKLGVPEILLALTQEGLVPICAASFTRKARLVSYGDSLLELALDEGSLMGGSRTQPLCEVEVELKSGAHSAADGFAALLAQTYRLEPEPRSKFQRALSLSKGE